MVLIIVLALKQGKQITNLNVHQQIYSSFEHVLVATFSKKVNQSFVLLMRSLCKVCTVLYQISPIAHYLISTITIQLFVISCSSLIQYQQYRVYLLCYGVHYIESKNKHTLSEKNILISLHLPSTVFTLEHCQSFMHNKYSMLRLKYVLKRSI